MAVGTAVVDAVVGAPNIGGSTPLGKVLGKPGNAVAEPRDILSPVGIARDVLRSLNVSDSESVGKLRDSAGELSEGNVKLGISVVRPEVRDTAGKVTDTLGTLSNELGCIVGKPVGRLSGKLSVGLGRFKDKERSEGSKLSSDVKVGKLIVGSEGSRRGLNSRSGMLVVRTPARSLVGSPSVMLKVGITTLGSVIAGEIVGSDKLVGNVIDRSGKVGVGTERSDDSPGNMSVDNASVGRDKLPGSEISPVSVAKTEPRSEVGSPGSIDGSDDGTSGMRSDAFNMPVNTVTVNGGGTKVTVKAHSDSASSPDPWASTPRPAKTKAQAKKHFKGENRCIVHVNDARHDVVASSLLL